MAYHSTLKYIDFINVWLSFHLGKIVKIFKEKYDTVAVRGSLNSLYTGLSDVDVAYFCVKGAKQILHMYKYMKQIFSFGPKLSLKVVVNKERTKVLFAEANSDFINVLLSFLALHLGKVVRILRDHYGEPAPAIGSLNTLHASLLDLDESYFCVGGAKQMLLNLPTSLREECLKLALDITDTLPDNQFFLCQDQSCSKFGLQISLYPDIAKCVCGKWLSREIRLPESKMDGGAFITTSSSFIITDYLNVVEPMTGIIQMLNNLGTADTQGAEMLTVSFGLNEIRDLLNFSLTSATPLTDVIIKKTQISSSPEAGILFRNIQKGDSNSRKIVLKVCLQKSTNKFLFAVATDEFVDMLFSFMAVPLGGVEFLLGGKTGLKNIDNLYTNVSNGIYDEYFTAPETKSRLINPKLPHGYISKNQFLPLSEEAPPELFCQWKLNKELYVKKQKFWVVTDDLTVSPCLATSFSTVSGLGIPLSDVKEMELPVGLEEALSILKASLTSKTALTDGLIKPILNKIPKLEQELS